MDGELLSSNGQTAAAHHLMVDFHGAYKPDGLSRTWPNIITREGVMGLEHAKSTARITPDHDIMLSVHPNAGRPDGLHSRRIQ